MRQIRLVVVCVSSEVYNRDNYSWKEYGDFVVQSMAFIFRSWSNHLDKVVAGLPSDPENELNELVAACLLCDAGRKPKSLWPANWFLRWRQNVKKEQQRRRRNRRLLLLLLLTIQFIWSARDWANPFGFVQPRLPFVWDLGSLLEFAPLVLPFLLLF